MTEPVDHDPKDLEELLDQLNSATDADQSQLTVEEILTAVGIRSFAPILLLIGALITSPLSGVPAFPTVTAIIIFLVSLQMLVGRKHFWFPAWLLQRSVPQEKITASVKWLRPPARFIDYFIRPRLTILVKGPATAMIALCSMIIASGMPLLELIPFSSSLAGLTFAAFGLALISHDGLLALLAYLAAGATIWVCIYGLIL